MESKKKVTVIKGNPQRGQKGKPGNPKSKIRVCAYCRVSTMEAEQEDSFNSQVTYYTDQIKKNPDWEFAGIYADQGITGTSASKRPEFQRMFADAMAGKIDVILTKSLSRFARNTVDTLNYVRALKEKGIAVVFEEEGFNTLTQQGEFSLTILSSVAQQEVENTSEHVKRGLAMKMQEGKLVGFPSCLGYDYDPVTKTISVNKAEAEIVKYIFKRYCEGAGTTVLARELKEKGYKTKSGDDRWFDTTILGVLKNEKYVGDVVQGKTFTVDPISGRRLRNKGESDIYLIKDHHEPIISRETFDKANAILKKRSYSRIINEDGTRSRYSREYNFSSIMQCGFCGKVYVRRCWHGSENYKKVVWECQGFAKGGRKTCPNSKGVPEELIENAFVESYNRLVASDKDLMERLLEHTEQALASNDSEGELNKIEGELDKLKRKESKLLTLFMEEKVTKDDYDAQYESLTAKEKELRKKKEALSYKADQDKYIHEQIVKVSQKLSEMGGKTTESFDPSLFEIAVEKVIVGGNEKDGTPDPYKITFVYKNAFGEGRKALGKPIDGKYIKVLTFDFHYQHCEFVFKDGGKQKIIKDWVTVEVAFDVRG